MVFLGLGLTMSSLEAQVAIVHAQNIDDDALVRSRMYELLDLLRDSIQVPPNARVVIKINLCLLLDCETGATTDPRLVQFLAQWLLDHRSIREIVIAESDATTLNADRAFYGLGWDRILAEVPKTRYLNLSRDERVKVKVNGLFLKEVEMARTFMEADYLISFAKLKMHSMQVITGIMKNQFGALPEKLKVVYHPHLAKVICDVVRIRPPDLCLVDGLIGHEGPGPVSGTPRLMGLIVAGTDAVATDHACARLMGKNPRRVPALKLAARHNLGTTSYATLGCRIEDVAQDFAFIPQWRRAWMLLREHVQNR
jgi:uncharacterized protein (DUF362 family)